MRRALEQAAAVTLFLLGPFQRRTGAVFLQEAQAGRRAGFERAANTAAIAGLPLSRLGWRRQVEMDDLLFHVA